MVAEGFDRVALERDEPGLFNAGGDGNEPPQFRIRRAVGPVADPIYASALVNGALALEDAEASATVFSATYTDDNGGEGLEPFVRYVFWADVRLPPERRLPAGFDPLDPPGGVTAVDPDARQSHPLPMSYPSAPCVLMHAPPSPPATPETANIAVSQAPAANGTVAVTINVTDPPSAHQKAVDQFRLAVWTQWPGGAIEPITNANGQSLSGTWPVMSGGVVTANVTVPPGADATAALTLRFAFVDPVGRMGEILPITAQRGALRKQPAPKSAALGGWRMTLELGDHVWYWNGKISLDQNIPRAQWFPGSNPDDPNDYQGHGKEIYQLRHPCRRNRTRASTHEEPRRQLRLARTTIPETSPARPGGPDFGQYPGKFNWHNFLIFPTWGDGFDAIAKLLRTPAYVNLSI